MSLQTCLSRLAACAVACMVVAVPATPSHALDREHRAIAETAIDEAIVYLREAQAEDGSWSSERGPAITGLIVAAMLDQPDIDATDPTVAKALDYIMSCVQDDGSIGSGSLLNYNTAICISALSRVRNDPEVASAIANGLDFLRGLQWNGQQDPAGNTITPDHPWYGGFGYGGSGRPDLSNMQFALTAFEDAGVTCDDPAVQRALVFLNRVQGTEQNDMYDEDVVIRDGGFIYSTTINSDHIGVPESKASPEMIDEGNAGNPVSGLRSYGSMTYAGFKSLVYADLDADDPRVAAVLEWSSQNYTMDANPGMPEDVNQQGLFYYYMTFSKALDAWGESFVTTSEGEEKDWANDVIAAIAQRQAEDGSWTNIEADRWMEGDPNLVTGYALTALNHALD